jgi:hypothetical protein
VVGIEIGDILSKTIGMLLSRHAFGFWRTQRFKGSYDENFNFDVMDATRPSSSPIFLVQSLNSAISNPENVEHSDFFETTLLKQIARVRFDSMVRIFHGHGNCSIVYSQKTNLLYRQVHFAKVQEGD